VTGLSALVGSESLKTWKDWMTAHAVAEHARLLSKAFVDADFEFRGKTLSGTPEQQPRWKRGVDATSDALGDAIGRLYVQKYFSAEAKARAKVMVDALVKAFAARVDRLSWLSEATRAKAKAKVATLTVGVGYPDTWVDYSGLTIDRADAFGNARRASAFEYQRQVAKLSKPVDRNEWWMTPQTVNAVNLPLQNALNFPAAILQPPFFDPEADPAANFGAMGTIIGHEISHSFDDSGAQFDAQGTFTNWWTDEDLAHFKAAGEQLAKQYDAYEPLPGLHLNGHQTLSENIADVAGLNTSWDAFVAQRPPAVTADGGAKNADAFTDEQRFFLSFAQVWRLKAREAAMRRLVITNGHAPGPYRALTVRNLDGWYQAFDVKPGQKLALPAEQRVRIW
jgi:putative endopeptidase